MGKTPKNQSLSKPLLPLLLGVLFPSLCFACFLGFGFSPFLVSFPIMILSTIFLFKFTKKKPTSDENQLSTQENTHLENESKEQLHQVVETEKQARNEVLEPISESVEENETAQEREDGIESGGLELEDFPSASEVSETSEIFEPNWNMSSTKVGHNLAIYECSFSDDCDDDDDDNLIEIALPGSDSSGFGGDPRPNLPDFLPESIFSEKGFMELLADINEMNEEDNLIEIDISMGSIKCPRFEIKA